jgi:uncharacterized cupin superfamily protein
MGAMVPVARWDEVEVEALSVGPMRGRWRDLATAAGSLRLGLVRGEIEPGARSSPVHRHGREEEFVFVLGGSGLSWQDGRTYELAAGDCVLHRANEEAHTLIASPGEALDVLIFGPREADEATHLPHAGVVRINEAWVAAMGGPEPWELEAAAGALPMPDAPSSPHERIVSLSQVPEEPAAHGPHAFVQRDLGVRLGSRSTGLRLTTIAAGHEGMPPHCHAAEEELFVVLSGSGMLLLGDQEWPVEAGAIVSRPAGTGVSHALRADPAGELVLLCYGERRPEDVVFYPRTGKALLRGLGVVVDARPEGAYWSYAAP